MRYVPRPLRIFGSDEIRQPPPGISQHIPSWAVPWPSLTPQEQYEQANDFWRQCSARCSAVYFYRGIPPWRFLKRRRRYKELVAEEMAANWMTSDYSQRLRAEGQR